MNVHIVGAGAVIGGVGCIMYYLLSGLRSVYFRAYLPPWIYVSYAVVIGGVALAVVGALVAPAPMSTLPTAVAARVLEDVSLVNAVVAAGFAALVLLPWLKFPILITQWPGIYMTIAFFSFVVVGVIGTFAWSVLYRNRQSSGRGEAIYKQLFLAQAVLGELGIVGLAIAMFSGGYVGASQSYAGFGPVVVGIDMEFSVIPSAVSIFLVIASTLAGVAVASLSGRRVRSQPQVTSAQGPSPQGPR